MIKFEEILDHLDRAAEKFNFPFFDDANFNIAQSKLSVYRNHWDWLITFEQVGYSILDFSNDLFAYSNCLHNEGLIAGFDNIISLTNQDCIYDGNGQFTVDPFNIHLKIWDESININPTIHDYRRGNINPHPFTSTKLIRFLSSIYEDKFWLSQKMIFSEVGMRKISKFISFTKWNHIVIDEKPSESLFFRQLSQAIEDNNPSQISSETSNTHWENWIEYDFNN
jgi:hypothetical protein